MVRLQREHYQICCPFCKSLNSTMVRLQLYINIEGSAPFWGLNSTMVRLQPLKL